MKSLKENGFFDGLEIPLDNGFPDYCKACSDNNPYNCGECPKLIKKSDAELRLREKVAELLKYIDNPKRLRTELPDVYLSIMNKHPEVKDYKNRITWITDEHIIQDSTILSLVLTLKGNEWYNHMLINDLLGCEKPITDTKGDVVSCQGILTDTKPYKPTQKKYPKVLTDGQQNVEPLASSVVGSQNPKDEIRRCKYGYGKYSEGKKEKK